jgi:lipoprotein NlpI
MKDPTVHYTLGITYIMAENYTEALEQFNKSIQIDPSSKNFCYRGLALYNLDRPAEALEDF